MIVCIAGMHRSGTSMVARCLNLCGLDLGLEAELTPAAPDNSEGFWEHRQFVALNDDLLRHLGGEWSKVPAMPKGWHSCPSLAELYRRASALLDNFRERQLWGWKDPRNAITLPFWLRVVDSAKIVVPVRNPLEVAASLSRRDKFSVAQALDLWTIYHERLFEGLPPAGCLVTHYDAYYADAAGELGRVLKSLGLPPEEESVAAATAKVFPHLRHHHMDFDDLLMAHQNPRLLGTPIPEATLRIYIRLREMAGPIFRAHEETTRDATHQSARRDRLALLRAEDELVRQDRLLADKERLLADKDRKIAQLQEQLRDVHTSRSWQLTRPLRWIADALNGGHDQ